ncbi:MAG: hypothetical protein IH602_01945 [Bryobacteraceae bacterium]|nr:hypothetical protein [Bryobacteraceae bacterium]
MQITQIARGLALPLIAAGALMAQPAQKPQPVTMMAYFKVPVDKVGAFTTKAKIFVPVLDSLLSAGTIFAYAIDVDYLHTPGGANVTFWYTAANMADLGKAEVAIGELISKNAQAMTELAAMHDMNQHRDVIVRSPVISMSPSSACAAKFGSSTTEKVKAGKVGDDVALFNKYWKGEMDALMKSGVICAYGYDVESFHTTAPGMTFRWVLVPDLGAFDKMRAASQAAWAKLPEAEQKLLDAFDEANYDASAHRDNLSSLVVYKSK